MGFSEVSAPLTAEAQALGARIGLYTLFFRFYILFRSDFQRFSAGI